MDWPIFWGAVSAVGAVASAVVAYVAARISQTNLRVASEMLRETRELRLADNDAEVIIYLEPVEFQFKFLNLVLENVGPGVAYDVLVKCINYSKIEDPGRSEINIDEIFFLGKKIPLLAPKQKLTTFIFSAVGKMASQVGIDPLIFEIQYRDSNNRIQSRRLEVDLRLIEGSRRVGSQSPAHDIERHVGKIAQAIEESTRGSRKLSVNIYTDRDRRLEQQALEEYYNAQQNNPDTQTLNGLSEMLLPPDE